ncbi:hypothetical protein [Brachybacterium sp.]|uniref:hypothetical protein n=1 Tax=Brachybacterium sp. TaxID=1891286 RepID=UPI002ED1E4BD
MAERGFKYDELAEADDATVERSRPNLHAAPCGHGVWVSALDGAVYEGHGGNEREQWSLHQRGPWVRLTDEDFLSSTHREVLARAEHRAARAEAQSAIRGRAVAIHRKRTQEAEADGEKRGDLILRALATSDTWQKRAKSAEARIKAVRDMLDRPADDTEGMDSISAHYANGYEIALQDIRRALDGDA